ncbi:MAG: DNA-directed RNA polymerase subunit alpha, partial [Candidatus Saccharimonadales bacterium]
HLPEIKIIDESDNVGEYAVEPLHRGFGVTIGNSLRRVLLSSLGGAAATAFSVEGATHEFTTLEGVREDAVMISLNLKRIKFKVYSDEPQTLTLSKKGKGPVTAGDFEGSSDVEIVNPDQLIANLDNDKAKLAMTLQVEKGRGYQTVDEQTQQLSVGMIGLDALFSPIKKVRYKVENTRVGQVTDLDKLIISIETDNSIAPREALEQAATILVNQFNTIAGGNTVEEIEEVEEEVEDLNISVADLEFSQRTFNALEKNGIVSLKQLAAMSEAELKSLKGFGAKALDEVVAKLKELELK